MATDIRLDDGPMDNWVTVDAPVLNIEGSDFILDSKVRRGGAMGGHRRALVHSEGDALAINFNGDYTGGVSIRNARLNVFCLHQVGAPKLPKSGIVGDLLLTHNRAMVGKVDAGVTVTLWLCVGRLNQITPGSAYWLPISTGQAIEGTD